jgi:hypothetical protein
MKKILINHYSLFILLAVALCACQKKETTSFQYNVDKFYDLEILRYDVPEFDSLTLQQKQLVYCLSEAALWGRDIFFDQNGRHNLRIRRALEALYVHKPHLTSPQGEESPLLGRGTGRGFTISQQACPLWVPLIENGEHRNAGADYFVDQYMRQILEKDPQIDTLILGCTHYPLLLPKIAQWIRNNGKRFAAGDIQVISQGYLEAKSLADYLVRHPEYESQLTQGGTCCYLTTENADRFSQSASLFLSAPVQAGHIDLE